MGKSIPKKIHFYFSFKPISLKDRTKLKTFIEKICACEKQKLQQVNFIFCNNKKIRALNKKFLSHDHNTDILTFLLSPKKSPLVADIYISQEQVLKNASIFKTSFKNEIHRVIFHGVLHLCGYDDKTDRQKTAMKKMENSCLEQYFGLFHVEHIPLQPL